MLRPNAPGFLLVVEGIDGAGKSTLIRHLAEHLVSLGRSPLLSREPTDGPFGAALRASARTGRLDLEAELDLFLKDREEHVREVIRPGLAAGRIVLLDRYYLSTAAYQGARGADPALILAANEAFAPLPDLALLLDLLPESGASRIRRRGDLPDDFEAVVYLEKVRAIFQSLQRPFLQRVDATQSAAKVFSTSVALLTAVLQEEAAPPPVGA